MQKLFIKAFGELFPVLTAQSDAKANELCAISNLSVLDTDPKTNTVYLAPSTSMRPKDEPELVFIKALSNGNLYAERKDLTADQFRNLDVSMPDFEPLGVLVMNEWLFSDNLALVAQLDTVIAQQMPKFDFPEEFKADMYKNFLAIHHD